MKPIWDYSRVKSHKKERKGVEADRNVLGFSVLVTLVRERRYLTLSIWKIKSNSQTFSKHLSRVSTKT